MKWRGLQTILQTEIISDRNNKRRLPTKGTIAFGKNIQRCKIGKRGESEDIWNKNHLPKVFDHEIMNVTKTGNIQGEVIYKWHSKLASLMLYISNKMNGKSMVLISTRHGMFQSLWLTAFRGARHMIGKINKMHELESLMTSPPFKSWMFHEHATKQNSKMHEWIGIIRLIKYWMIQWTCDYKDYYAL